MLRRFNGELKCLIDLKGKDPAVVLAVSGGVDSMVLLDFFLKDSTINTDKIVVAHFNHCLRAISEEEAAFVEGYCRTRNIKYHYGEWSRQTDFRNLEKRARDARYDFLMEVCEKEKSSILVTGHHQNDLAETVLMKLTKGSRFSNLVGIRKFSQKKDVTVFRPLMTFNKNDLLEYSQIHQVPFVEDESNSQLHFQRNRFRKRVVPNLIEENPKFLQQISTFVKQMEYANDIIQKNVEDHCQRIYQRDSGWCLNLMGIEKLSKAEQYFLLDAFFQKAIENNELEIKQQQHENALELLMNEDGFKVIHLTDNWRLIKNYRELELVQKEAIEPLNLNAKLTVGETILPNQMGKLVLEDNSQEQVLLNRKDGHEIYSLEVTAEQLPLIVRCPVKGDAIVFNKAGQHKKINRLFIDRKIPRDKRDNFLVIEDNHKQILSLFSTEESYLSIGKETDKIHYRLTYLVNK